MTTGLVVLSGGMDSATALAWAVAVYDDVDAVTVDYGQRHRAEVDFAAALAHHYDVEQTIVNLRSVGALLSGSALTDTAVDVPDGHYADATMAATVVPNRNAILASVAAGIAVARKADAIVLGVHAGDHAVYPDCRPEFIAALQVLLDVANEGYHRVRVDAPFVHLAKHHIAALGARLGVPYAMTWSCYKGGKHHCGTCGTCVERIEAFALAGVDDPTEYAAPS